MFHNKKINILDLSKKELTDSVLAMDIAKFRGQQIWHWLYQKGATSFAQMTNLGKDTQNLLEQNFIIDRPTIKSTHQSQDGTCKWLVSFSDCKEVEVVFIPEKTRGTLCISSQVGCTLSCKFCHTGTQMLVRNLTAYEIVAQVLIAKDFLKDWQQQKIITNIVFMGMGEPFFNYNNVATAVNILKDEEGLKFTKITISTSGLVPEILKCANELKTGLAISLHATNDNLRSEIMAINKKYPLQQLMQACKTYNIITKQRITFEYTLLNGINDSLEQARELVNLIKKNNVNAKINLIPFNFWQGAIYQPSSLTIIGKFQKFLQDHKLIATIRKTRGDQVLAACGQLKSTSIRTKTSHDKKN